MSNLTTINIENVPEEITSLNYSKFNVEKVKRGSLKSIKNIHFHKLPAEMDPDASCNIFVDVYEPDVAVPENCKLFVPLKYIDDTGKGREAERKIKFFDFNNLNNEMFKHDHYKLSWPAQFEIEGQTYYAYKKYSDSDGFCMDLRRRGGFVRQNYSGTYNK